MRTLLIECGVAETRGALLEDDEIRQFFFAPARGDEGLLRPAQHCDVYLGRVRTISKSINGAFIDIGDAEDGFLPLTDKMKAPYEGESLVVRVHRPALREKGAVLAKDWTKGLSKCDQESIEEKAKTFTPPHRVNASEDAIADLLSIAPMPVDMVRVDTVSAAALFKRSAKLDVETGEALFEESGAEDALENALQRSVSTPGGGRLIFDETAGGCIIDVDAGEAVGAASKPLNDKVNAAAARAIVSEISRRAIGGRIIVDFLPPSSSEARGVLLKTLSAGVSKQLDGRAGKLSADGLFDMTVPRTRPSLLDYVSEPAGGDLLRPGRRLTQDWVTKEAIRRLETVLKRAPSSRPCLLLSADLKGYLAERSQWATRLADRYGARFLIEEADGLKGRTYDLAE